MIMTPRTPFLGKIIGLSHLSVKRFISLSNAALSAKSPNVWTIGNGCGAIAAKTKVTASKLLPNCHARAETHHDKGFNADFLLTVSKRRI